MSDFKVDISDVYGKLNKLQKIMFDVVLSVYCDTASKNFESYAKKNRPWTDRTGHARQRLKGYFERTKTGYKVVISHGVDYGIWLEFAKEKKYAILEPTVRKKSPEVLAGLNAILEGIQL